MQYVIYIKAIARTCLTLYDDAKCVYVCVSMCMCVYVCVHERVCVRRTLYGVHYKHYVIYTPVIYILSYVIYTPIYIKALCTNAIGNLK